MCDFYSRFMISSEISVFMKKKQQNRSSDNSVLVIPLVDNANDNGVVSFT